MVAAFAVGAANPNANVAAAKTATNLIVFFKVFLQGMIEWVCVDEPSSER
jgi:hypothetical protein